MTLFTFCKLSLAFASFLVFSAPTDAVQLRDVWSRRTGSSASTSNTVIEGLLESMQGNGTNSTVTPGSMESRGGGLNGERCATDEECRNPRKCLTASTSGMSKCEHDTLVCMCLDLRSKQCTSNRDCESGERCSLLEHGTDHKNICFSKVAGEQLNIAEVNSCIDVRALGEFRKEGLVFEKDRIGRVYCDGQESCATGGHMVVYRGNGMMMKSYCEIVKCEVRNMLVNSPKFASGLRVKSNTKGLEYSAFAAKYESRAEELSMRVAIKAGF